MSNDDRSDPDQDGRAPAVPRRRAIIVGSIVAGLVVVGLITALVISVAASGPGSTPSASSAAPSDAPTASASPSETPAPDPTPSETSADAPIADDVFGTPVATQVAVTDTASVQDVTVSIVSIEEESATGQRPGETSGSAIRVVVRVLNEGGGDLDLAGIAVRAYTGSELVPASPVDEGSGFSGTAPAGAEATGTYVFSVPEDSVGSVTLTVSVSADSGLAVFTP